MRISDWSSDVCSSDLKTRGQDAPAACVASVKRAMTLPFDEAVARDRDAFATLSAGRQSRALRHIFFAERQAARLAAGTARPVTRPAIVGAGTMGGGIAMSFAAAGLPVTDRKSTRLNPSHSC